MDQSFVRVVVIVGSTRGGRCALTITSWFTDRARQRPDVVVDILDLAEVSLPTALAPRIGDDAPDDTGEIAARLHAADAFVVVTPEYNHSYPASLKTAIDWFNVEWHAKPVGFVSYGGMSGGLRAVEHLRHVFAELHATTVRNTVSFANFWDHFDGSGRLVRPEAFDRAAARMLDQLVWWARALRAAREEHPYIG